MLINGRGGMFYIMKVFIVDLVYEFIKLVILSVYCFNYLINFIFNYNFFKIYLKVLFRG